MVSLVSLWLPILLSAVLVFVLSVLVHMVLGYHKSDFAGLPNEEQARAALRPLNIAPGEYLIPKAPGGGAGHRDPAYMAKFQEGPVAFLSMFPSGQMAMGKQLGQWFVYCLAMSAFAGYVASRVLAPGTAYLDVFTLVAAVAFAAYGLAIPQASIWFRRRWAVSLKSVFDGVLYGLGTAGVFGWLWPV